MSFSKIKEKSILKRAGAKKHLKKLQGINIPLPNQRYKYYSN